MYFGLLEALSGFVIPFSSQPLFRVRYDYALALRDVLGYFPVVFVDVLPLWSCTLVLLSHQGPAPLDVPRLLVEVSASAGSSVPHRITRLSCTLIASLDAHGAEVSVLRRGRDFPLETHMLQTLAPIVPRSEAGKAVSDRAGSDPRRVSTYSTRERVVSVS